MRSYCAIYVDAGYLYASAATRVIGTSLRSGVKVDNHALVNGLIAQAEAMKALLKNISGCRCETLVQCGHALHRGRLKWARPKKTTHG